MKAARFHEFHQPLTIDHVPLPSLLADGIIVKVQATGVCRSDWHAWSGHDADILSVGLPFIPGHEFAGVVTQVGSLVSRFKVNDRVAVPFILCCGSCLECSKGRTTICRDQKQPGFTLQGSFAEFVGIPRADLNVCKMPSNVSFVQAAALGCRYAMQCMVFFVFECSFTLICEHVCSVFTLIFALGFAVFFALGFAVFLL